MASWVEDVGRRVVLQLECGATALPTPPDSTTTTWMPHLARIHISRLCYTRTHTHTLGFRQALLSRRPWRALHRMAHGDVLCGRRWASLASAPMSPPDSLHALALTLFQSPAS